MQTTPFGLLPAGYVLGHSGSITSIDSGSNIEDRLKREKKEQFRHIKVFLSFFR
jgi:hypothetical protein